MPPRPAAARPEAGSLRPAAAPARGLLRRIRLWIRVAGERRALAELDARALRDIGLSREDARREIARPFWDLPDWRR